MALAFAAACSDDDSAQRQVQQLCDCEKIIEVYDPNRQVYDAVEVLPYSNNCADDTHGSRGTDSEGRTYSIRCELQGGTE